MYSSSSIVKKIKAAGIGIAAGILFCELALRIYNPSPATIKNKQLLLPANQHMVFSNTHIPQLDKQIHYSRNSLGMRGPELPADKNRLITLITAGGSTTECKFLSDSATWPFRLYMRMRDKHPDIWLNNAGIDGHTTFGHIALVRDYLVRLKPRYLLLMTGVNDVELDAPDEFDLASRKKINTGSMKTLLKSLANHTELGRAFLNYYQLKVSFKKGMVHRSILLGSLVENPLSDSVIQAKLNKQIPYLNGYRERIDSIIRMCHAAGIQPVLITQPTLYGDYTDSATGVRTGNKWFSKDPAGENFSLMKRIMEQYNDVLRSFSANAVVIDLSAKMEPRSEYYYDFTHVTNAGAEKMAALLAPALEAVIYKNKSK